MNARGKSNQDMHIQSPYRTCFDCGEQNLFPVPILINNSFTQGSLVTEMWLYRIKKRPFIYPGLAVPYHNPPCALEAKMGITPYIEIVIPVDIS